MAFPFGFATAGYLKDEGKNNAQKKKTTICTNYTHSHTHTHTHTIKRELAKDDTKWQE